MRHVSFLNNTCHVLSKCQQRFFSGTICDDAKSKLKELYRKIHPDLFHSDPKAKVGLLFSSSSCKPFAFVVTVV
jgi:hypothetical protein